MTLSHITKALQAGARLHAFCSGGALRVVRIERGKRGGKLIGYGEHPNIEEALNLTNKTLRPVIGRMPKKSVYLTGASSAESPLDEWILCGNTFDAWAKADGQIVVQLLNENYSDEVPETLLKEAIAHGSADWHNRGGIHQVHSVSYHPKRDEHRYDYSLKEIKRCTQNVRYPVAKIGRGKNFDEALQEALKAPQLEINIEIAA